MDSEIARRRFLGLVTLSTALPLAGCGLFEGQSDDDPASPGASPTVAPTPTAVNSDGSTPTGGTTPTVRRLTWGESITSPQGLELAVRGGSFTDTYSGGGSNETITPPADRTFAVILVEVRNPTSDTLKLPSLGYFHVRVSDTTYDVLLSDPSIQIPIEAGNTRQIRLPFLVPAGTESSDLAVLWTPVYESGRIAVSWASG